jgi:ribosome-interacting GTPase 1
MPANLTPQYKSAEERFRAATAHDEKLAALREMMALLPKHKGTEKLQADLRRRIAKLEDEGQHARKGGAHRHDPGHVVREGAGQWVLLGPPNAGKSALLRALTHAHPEVAPYPFTTRSPLPGMMPFEDVQVQLIDTPAVSAHHTESYLIGMVHSTDGVVWVLDVTAPDAEESVPALLALLDRARVWPLARPRPADLPQFVLGKPVVAVANKSDLDEGGLLVDALHRTLPAELPLVPVSAEHGTGLEALRARLFSELSRMRVYAKEPGKQPDRERPFVLPAGATVHDLALAVHKEIADRLKYARIWGHARFDGQQVDRDHVLFDRDVVELHA